MHNPKAKQHLLCFGLAFCIAFAAFPQEGEYLWGKEKSHAFITNTNADDIFKLWFGAKMRFALNECVVGEDGKKRTYSNGILVVESQSNDDTTYQFGLKFADKSSAFNYYHDVKNQMSLFVPIRNDNNMFAAFFDDGDFLLELSDDEVFILIALFEK